MTRIVGLDVGGANLKAAPLEGPALSRPYALWKDPAGLSAALQQLYAELPPAQRLAVTMTGELCDCYPNRATGVRAILSALADAAPAVPIRLWTLDGHFVNVKDAWAAPLRVASANWLALAAFAGRLAPHGAALLLDIGTTTTDIIPLLGGQPMPLGWTDAERLRSGELVYRGWRRTPLCALGGGAAELFATTLDVCLVLGLVPEDAADHDSADGRPATVTAAHARLARMLGADVETSTSEERLTYATAVLTRLLEDIADGLTRVLDRLPTAPAHFLLSGSGEFLARMLLAREPRLSAVTVRSLREELGPARSMASCAYAVALLNREREG
jgi:(4-(4-[2-(gamma-L-glutamylamino)ethyl]phenoxymethyl)furan-2-yl)methanamine synthase